MARAGPVAYGALAAFRLIPLLADELARCVAPAEPRGVGAGWNADRLGAHRVALLFALLVQAIRRAIRLAAAMDGRGFDTGTTRTFARDSVLPRTDWVHGGQRLVTALAVAVSVSTGQWRFLFG